MAPSVYVLKEMSQQAVCTNSEHSKWISKAITHWLPFTTGTVILTIGQCHRKQYKRVNFQRDYYRAASKLSVKQPEAKKTPTGIFAEAVYTITPMHNMFESDHTT